MDCTNIYEKITQDKDQEPFLSSGIVIFKIHNAPYKTDFIRIIAKFNHKDYASVEASTYAYKAFTDQDHYIHVRSSTNQIRDPYEMHDHIKIII